ncbi:MAG: hypothetical protein DMG54_02165 [Acidobacteria bacterium]|nr:MAG: hypothetical protein DMG54_02165 [Acidobacteriota bacterium]PYU69597.1 MAG: hypothetical protein DMG52_28470 [Acidobacteriota bacterium]
MARDTGHFVFGITINLIRRCLRHKDLPEVVQPIPAVLDRPSPGQQMRPLNDIAQKIAAVRDGLQPPAARIQPEPAICKPVSGELIRLQVVDTM